MLLGQQSWFLERLCADHHGPGHARDLIGKRNSGNLDRPALHNMCKPEPPRAMLPRISDNGHGAAIANTDFPVLRFYPDVPCRRSNAAWEQAQSKPPSFVRTRTLSNHRLLRPGRW